MRRFPAVLAAAAFLGLAVTTNAFLLPDSDQRKCYQDVDPFAEIPCTGTGQDGAYVMHPLRYTDNGDGTVTDNNTGLEWQQEDDGLTYDWYRASGTVDATYNPGGQDVCGSLEFAGHSDWRLPSPNELMSIVDYALTYPGPTVDTGYFTNTKAYVYWSSTSFTDTTARSVSFDYGLVSWSYKNDPFYVWCVRGGQAPVALTDNGNGTVTDGRTGLAWQQGEPGPMDWGAALGYCEGLPLGGVTDWRLPNIKELESLVDATRTDPAIDTTFFPGALSSLYWSSTSAPDSPAYAWIAHFYGGYTYSSAKASGSNVRCVRGGGYAIKGMVRTNLGLPLSRVNMKLTVQGETLPLMTARTSRRGRFLLSNVPPGTYILKPVKMDWQFLPRRRTVVIVDTDLLRRNFTGTPR